MVVLRSYRLCEPLRSRLRFRVRHRFPRGQSLPRHLQIDAGGSESLHSSKSWSMIECKL